MSLESPQPQGSGPPREKELEKLVRGLAPGLLRYCRAQTGEPFLAEEIAQEALAALVTRWRRGAPPDSPEAFVFTIARRRARRRLRKRRLLAPLESLLERRSSEPDPETRMVDQQRLERVRRSLPSLSPRDREALLLALVGDLDTVTAARALGISKSAFKMRLHRARRRLSQQTDLHPSLETSDEPIP